MYISRSRNQNNYSFFQVSPPKLSAFTCLDKPDHLNARIPLKREFAHYNAARDRFGTWNHAVEAAGFKPNPVLFARKHRANDGHKCDSLAEKIIDDWLAQKGFTHERSVPYPEGNRLTADFAVGHRWVEFFGLAGEIKEYDRLVKQKQKICKKHGIPLVEIYPKDLFPTNRLSEIFNM